MSMRQMSEGVLPGFCKIQVSIAIKDAPATDSFYGLADKNPRVLIACFTPINDYYVGN